MEKKEFYRYDSVEYAEIGYNDEYQRPSFPNPKLVLRTYNLYKETPKGYWIGYGYYQPEKLRSQGIWVSKTARKRYAYPTKEEALNNFIKRNEKRIKILTRQLDVCEINVRIANQELKKL